MARLLSSLPLPLLAALALAAGGAAGCGTSSIDRDPPPVELPVIAAFTASPAALMAGGSATLSWTVTGATALTLAPGPGAVSGSSLAVSPAATTSYTLTATNAAGSTSATATVTVTVPPPPVSVAVSPATAELLAGATAAFSATVENALDTSVTWSVTEAGGGSVSTAGLYTAPAVAGTFHVVATSNADPGKSATATVTVTVPPPPVTVAVSPATAELLAGATAAFSATVENALDTSVTWSVTEAGGGSVSTAGLYTAPAVAGTFHVVATSNADPGKSATATVTVTVPPPPVDADVTVVVDTTRARRPISPFVYGASATDPPPGATLLRVGGNRYTAWNWELNYSNSGSNYWYWLLNDTNLGVPSDGPAAAIQRRLATAKATGAGLCATVPIQGWVAKDGAGAVSATAPVTDRFLPNEPRRGSAFPATPDTGDGAVYQDELAAYLDARWSGAASPLHLELDNEPGIWHETHPEIQRAHVTYEELLARTIASASALKDAAPSALVLGPVGYGWNEFTSLQNAPDAALHGDFLDYYLEGTRAAGAAQGRRLLDALDIHYYSEAQGGGVRVAESGAGNTSDAVVLARVHAPRSLVDGYVESSWIANSLGGAPIRLIPRMLAKIAAHHPGTRLAITEYDFGGEAHISGTVALADALGLFGREGVYAAAYWPVLDDTSWANAAWLLYRDYDGLGSTFGDTSVQAASGDVAHLSAFASVDAAGGDRVVLVLVHRPTSADGGLYTRARTVRLEVGHPAALGRARLWQVTRDAPVTGGAARPQRLTDLTVVGNALTVTVPAMSVTVVELTR